MLIAVGAAIARERNYTPVGQRVAAIKRRMGSEIGAIPMEVID